MITTQVMRTLLFTIFLFISEPVFCQDQQSIMEMADAAFARQEYAVAGGLYAKQAEKKGRHATIPLLKKTAWCYNEIGRFDEAGYWCEKMVKREDCPPEVFALYGGILKRAEKYTEAKAYIARFTSNNNDSIHWKENMLLGCDSALIWKTDTMRAAVENIKELSSTGDDWISGVMMQGLLMVSNGYRKMSLNGPPERNPKIDPKISKPYFKAYLFKQYEKGKANTFLEEILPDLLGDIPYNIGPVCFNATEDTMYATLNTWDRDMADKKKKGPVNGKRMMALFWSVKEKDTWRPLQMMDVINHKGSSSGHAAIGPEGRFLYFVSDRPGGIGQSDIWYSERQADGTWGTPLNCGAGINTPFDDAFPTINEPGMLYFSSNGHAGMGGYDLFRATGEAGEWHTLQNLRCPFNSGADDIGFIMKSNQYEGYFSSGRPGGGGGDDVYHFMDTHFSEHITQPKPGEPVAISPPVLPQIDSTVVTKLEQLRFYYDFNSAELLTESIDLLDRVATVLLQYPSVKLGIRSFADSRGSDRYNIDLSAMRCYTVIDYLIKKGIDPKRLYYYNLGERQLVNTCGDGVRCPEKQHRENRFSSLKVIQ